LRQASGAGQGFGCFGMRFSENPLLAGTPVGI
jgi:hypothetical protein